MTPSVMTDVIAYNFNIDATDFIDQLQNTPAPGLSHETFLHDLARQGDVLSAEVALETGSKVDQPNEIGRRPLHEAASAGQVEMMAFLLDNGALLDAPIHPFGHTALYLAVGQKRHAAARYLICRGARLNIEDSLMGTGLLHLAAENGDVMMTGILIAAGADVFREDKKGHTARDTAMAHGYADLSRTLLKIMEHHAKYAA